MRELTEWWLTRTAAVREPIHEKLTLLWHNHFATSARKVKHATHMGLQNQIFRKLKWGDFRELAYSMLSDAAILAWLDGKGNVAASPNEIYPASSWSCSRSATATATQRPMSARAQRP